MQKHIFLRTLFSALIFAALYAPASPAGEAPPGFLNKHKGLARVYYDEALRLEKEKDYSKALVHLKTAAKSDPENAQIQEALARVDARLNRGLKTIGAGMTRPEEVFLTTGDIVDGYRVLGVVKATHAQGGRERVDAELRRGAQAKGADGLIRVHYIERAGRLHAIGTAVKLR